VYSNKFDRWLTLGTNLSVLVGLILLMVEINQNNELVRVQIEQMRSDTYVSWMREVASGDNVAPLLAKIELLGGESGNFDLTQLDSTEKQRYMAIAAARFYDYENLYAQYQRGFVSEEYWTQRIVPAIRKWAPIWAILFGPDELARRRGFRDEVDRIIKEQS